MVKVLLIFVFFFSFLNASLYAASKILFYKVQAGDNISSVLDDLGLCPLYGEGGHVDKIVII